MHTEVKSPVDLVLFPEYNCPRLLFHDIPPTSTKAPTHDENCLGKQLLSIIIHAKRYLNTGECKFHARDYVQHANFHGVGEQ